ncbi:BAQ_1a_G0038500.mRNA.1.CDS.1 [Saccharomyces cerevisiae]|nr:BAQ_1a_G0038500.mRNA.1.CDS.1 [Saccharomyces cerevisiae]CAI4669109.1 BAM_G0038510.mRNA.1.CDS.1 [Saccharomyces cerevisiae]CAI7247900.1 BAM_G0038510.mRNA.1.CDS.1 [Saccharomyces cerevisiae]CAI7248424.1 BAQ_1a_G0038500.mRNA.1.CDS.1 [Saccharomyces cerevisiae]
MAPKSSSSGSKKKSSASSNSADAKASKFKLPAEFITRPHPSKDHGKETCTAYIHPNVLSSLEINPGSFCTVGKIGENGILVIARASDEEVHPVNVITLSTTIRSVGNLILGDRLELKKAQVQPPYATKVTVGSLQGHNILECMEEKVIQKLLDDSGVIMPGMIFQNLKTKAGDESINVVITDASDDSLPDVSQLDLNMDDMYGGLDNLFYLSPPFIFRKGSTHITFSKETQANRKYNLPEPLSYAAVGGLDKEIESLKSAIEIPLHQPTLFSSFGVSPPRGILLHGPPGTGKTMLLRVVANTSNAHVLTINGPSIVSKYLGETEAALRDIFNEARKYQPSIIFIDEIDSIAPNRANDDSGEVESRVVATLLTLMDGMGAAGKVVVIAATNRPNSVDPALRRPGRFDQEVEIGIPDVDARFDILTKQFSRMSSDRHVLDSEAIKYIASKTHGYVGADLTALCRESVMKTIQRGLGTDANIDKFSLKVTLKDVESAMVDIRPSAMREIFLEMPKVYWSDIGGQEELKTKMKEMIQLPLEASETFARLGISAPKGVLLYGPPGCSKTLTAKALATESGINFLAVKGPEIFNKYVGESERAIREIFRKARSAAPSIIFFDEIDALSPDRDGSSTSAANHVLTSLLNEIDGVEELKGVVIVAATNRPDEIDAALLRPGRLDRHIYVGPPDVNARLEILKKCTKKFNTEESGVDLHELADRTEGYSGAEVVLLCQEAGLAAIMEDLDVAKVELRHFEKAFKGIARGITPEMLSYYEEFALRSGSSS